MRERVRGGGGDRQAVRLRAAEERRLDERCAEGRAGQAREGRRPSGGSAAAVETPVVRAAGAIERVPSMDFDLERAIAESMRDSQPHVAERLQHPDRDHPGALGRMDRYFSLPSARGGGGRGGRGPETPRQVVDDFGDVRNIEEPASVIPMGAEWAPAHVGARGTGAPRSSVVAVHDTRHHAREGRDRRVAQRGSEGREGARQSASAGGAEMPPPRENVDHRIQRLLEQVTRDPNRPRTGAVAAVARTNTSCSGSSVPAVPSLGVVPRVQAAAAAGQAAAARAAPSAHAAHMPRPPTQRPSAPSGGGQRSSRPTPGVNATAAAAGAARVTAIAPRNSQAALPIAHQSLLPIAHNSLTPDASTHASTPAAAPSARTATGQQHIWGGFGKPPQQQQQRAAAAGPTSAAVVAAATAATSAATTAATTANTPASGYILGRALSAAEAVIPRHAPVAPLFGRANSGGNVAPPPSSTVCAPRATAAAHSMMGVGGGSVVAEGAEHIHTHTHSTPRQMQGAGGSAEEDADSVRTPPLARGGMTEREKRAIAAERRFAMM